MNFGIKQKILLVLVAVLALTTALDALLASYFTNRQNQESAFADLDRDLFTWRNDLQALTLQLREVALATMGDAVVLNQLAELITLEVSLDDPARSKDFKETARTFAYSKTVSLNRLQLALHTGGLSSIAVYTGGKLSHYVSASGAGMMLRGEEAGPVWVAAAADEHGNLPFRSWPSWSEGELPPDVAASRPALQQPAVSFNFPAAEYTAIEVAIPVQGLMEQMWTDSSMQPVARFASKLAIAGLANNRDSESPDRPPATLAVVVFRRLIDRAALEELAKKTGKWPVLFSPDGGHRQQLTDSIPAPTELVQKARTLPSGAQPQVMQRIVTSGRKSFYQALLPWQFENQPGLMLCLASSRDSTLQNVRQTVTAILTAAGLILLLSIGVGIFWVGRFIDPIVALTSAVKDVGVKSRLGSESSPGHQTAIQELRQIAIRAPDEIGDLASAFNVMIAELRQSFETLEQRVQTRTAELRQQTRYLQTLFDTLPVGVWLKDTENRYLAVNQTTAQDCGLRVEDMVGKTDLDLWPRERAESYRSEDAKVMATRQRTTAEEPFDGAKGIIWIEAYKAPVLDEDGTVLGIVGVSRDITQQKAAESAREAALSEAVRLARLRSEFLAQMSHELRTPLNAILGYAQILRRDKRLTERQATGLATIQESGQHLLTLINDILDLSRIEAAKLELYPAEVNLAAFLRIVVDIIRVKADEKSLVFTYQPAENLPAAVRVDDKRLRQVLLNLLGNAVKFTDAGRVTLRVASVPLAGPSPDCSAAQVRLHFEVEDSGIGMSDEQLARIFQPFEQVAEVQRREGGTGLGLAISRQLVRLMGGDIQVQSRAGEGSRFSFELELPLGEAQAAILQRERNMIGYKGARKKLLVVDDVPQNRAMLMDALASLDFDVADAADGQEGLAQAESIGPDLILMDIMMPIMDGLEATRRIRLMPRFGQLPIIVVSASASREDEAKSYAAGANAFIPKPIEQEVLLKTIGELLSLDWIYEEPAPEPEQAAGTEEGDLIIPPPDEMQVLYQLALVGNMRDIRQRADYLKGLDPGYVAFAKRLEGLAQKYRSKAIVTLLEQYCTGCKGQQTERAPG